jgi:hypothetical protein
MYHRQKGMNKYQKTVKEGQLQDNDQKPLHSQKITVEVMTRLTVKVTVELIPPEVKLTPVWKVRMTADPDPQFIFENTDPDFHPGDVTKPYDADAVAKEFLNLKSPDAALTFFEKFPFDETNQRIRWSEIESIRKAFLSALANEPGPQDLALVFRPLQVQLLHDEKVVKVISSKPVKNEKFYAVVGIAECKDVLTSLRAVVFLSRGSVWRQCANPKCEMWFKPGRPDQMHHDPACTRRAIANRFNEKTRKANKKREGTRKANKKRRRK